MQLEENSQIEAAIEAQQKVQCLSESQQEVQCLSKAQQEVQRLTKTNRQAMLRIRELEVIVAGKIHTKSVGLGGERSPKNVVVDDDDDNKEEEKEDETSYQGHERTPPTRARAHTIATPTGDRRRGLPNLQDYLKREKKNVGAFHKVGAKPLEL